MSDLIERIKRIKMVISDFDGVFTDGSVYTDEHGVETVKCSRRDSLGITLLKRKAIFYGVISKEPNNVVQARCMKLEISCAGGIPTAASKVDVMERMMLDYNITDFGEVLFIGDDINDLECLKIAGVSVVAADCHHSLRKYAHYITAAPGGKGAIREVCEMVLEAKGFPIEI